MPCVFTWCLCIVRAMIASGIPGQKRCNLSNPAKAARYTHDMSGVHPGSLQPAQGLIMMYFNLLTLLQAAITHSLLHHATVMSSAWQAAHACMSELKTGRAQRCVTPSQCIIKIGLEMSSASSCAQHFRMHRLTTESKTTMMRGVLPLVGHCCPGLSNACTQVCCLDA